MGCSSSLPSQEKAQAAARASAGAFADADDAVDSAAAGAAQGQIQLRLEIQGGIRKAQALEARQVAWMEALSKQRTERLYTTISSQLTKAIRDGNCSLDGASRTLLITEKALCYCHAVSQYKCSGGFSFTYADSINESPHVRAILTELTAATVLCKEHFESLDPTLVWTIAAYNTMFLTRTFSLISIYFSVKERDAGL